MVPPVLAVITNYDFSDNADDLKRRLAPHFETLLIDNSSPTPPDEADLMLPNGHYTGLWNEAVRQALARGKRWLLFVAADVEIADAAQLAGALRSVLRKDSIGVYTPALRHDSRTSFPACLQRHTGHLRECFVVEGFCFLARTEILARLYPVDPAVNLYGWGIDVMTAYHSYRSGRRVMVDDRVEIYHPASRHTLPSTAQQEQMNRFVGKEGALFLEWTYERLRQEHRAGEIPRRLAAAMSRWLLRTRRQLGAADDARGWFTGRGMG